MQSHHGVRRGRIAPIDRYEGTTARMKQFFAYFHIDESIIYNFFIYKLGVSEVCKHNYGLGLSKSMLFSR